MKWKRIEWKVKEIKKNNEEKEVNNQNNHTMAQSAVL